MTMKKAANIDDGTALKSMTFEEVQDYVCRCIQQGKAKDLSHKNLRGLDLRHVGNGSLASWDLSSSDLRDVKFPPSMSYCAFHNAKLQGANLDNIDIKGADFTNACMSGVHLWTATLKDANLEWARWDDGYMVGNETAAGESTDNQIKAGLFQSAGGVYRQLKQAYQRYGLYDLAGEFYLREMECDRKKVKAEWIAGKRDWRTMMTLVHLSLSGLTFGYGERPWKLVGTGLMVLLAFAMIYYLGGLYHGLGFNDFLHSAYFSLASFTAVGYGAWIASALGSVKYLGAVEALVGTFILALFLVTFTRRFTR